MQCPLCHARLVVEHRWFYRPLMLLGCTAMGIPLAYLGGTRYDLLGGLAGWIIGATAIGMPWDKLLESKFSVLKLREEKSSKKTR
jgi:hypothetical protein